MLALSVREVGTVRHCLAVPGNRSRALCNNLAVLPLNDLDGVPIDCRVRDRARYLWPDMGAQRRCESGQRVLNVFAAVMLTWEVNPNAGTPVSALPPEY